MPHGLVLKMRAVAHEIYWLLVIVFPVFLVVYFQLVRP